MATKRVLVVCTVHNERGKANAGELVWLLGRLDADVIFLEYSPANFPKFLEGSFGLESKAVMRYRQGKPVHLVPADIHSSTNTLAELRKQKQLFDELNDAIYDAMPLLDHW